MHGAGPALTGAAAVLRAMQFEDVAKHPQQGHLGRNVHRGGFSVEGKGCRHWPIIEEERNSGAEELGSWGRRACLAVVPKERKSLPRRSSEGAKAGKWWKMKGWGGY